MVLLFKNFIMTRVNDVQKHRIMFFLVSADDLVMDRQLNIIILILLLSTYKVLMQGQKFTGYNFFITHVLCRCIL